MLSYSSFWHCAALASASARLSAERGLTRGSQTAAKLAEQLGRASTIVWNGPVGVFEFDQFGHGTETLARAIAAAKGFSIAGGGDTLAAIAKYGVTSGCGELVKCAQVGFINGQAPVAFITEHTHLDQCVGCV